MSAAPAFFARRCGRLTVLCSFDGPDCSFYLLSFQVAPSLVSFTSKPNAARSSRILSLVAQSFSAFGAQFEQEVYGAAEALLAFGVACGFRLEAEDVESEGVHYLPQSLQSFGSDGLLLVGQLVDGTAGVEEMTDDNG